MRSTILIGITISGDGTSHKNENYETKNATVVDQKGNTIQFFLGIQMAVNHTSQTQLDGWVEEIEKMYDLVHSSGLCSKTEAREFWNHVVGMHSDHAEDQKKLVRLVEAQPAASGGGLELELPGAARMRITERSQVVLAVELLRGLASC